MCSGQIASTSGEERQGCPHDGELLRRRYLFPSLMGKPGGTTFEFNGTVRTVDFSLMKHKSKSSAYHSAGLAEERALVPLVGFG